MFVASAVHVMPDEVPNHRCIKNPNYVYDMDKQIMKWRSESCKTWSDAEEPMTAFHRPTVEKFLGNWPRYMELNIELKKLNDVQLYLLYMQVLEMVRGERKLKI